jgi:hypothetical protein
MRIRFQKTRISPTNIKRADEALERLGKMTQKRYILAKYLFGRCLACEVNGLLLLGVHTTSRPSKTGVLALEQQANGTILFPTWSERDLDLCISRLGCETDADVAAVRQQLGPIKPDPSER